MSVSLIKAAKAGDLAQVYQLIDQGASLDTCDEEGQTAMHWAVRGDYSHVCLALLHAGADPMARDEKGRAVLHHCAGYGAYRCAYALTSQAGSRLDPNARDNRGRTAMHACAMTDKRTEVHTVLGRVDLSVRDDDGFTALERAEQQGKELLAVSLRAYEQAQKGQGMAVRSPQRNRAPTGHRDPAPDPVPPPDLDVPPPVEEPAKPKPPAAQPDDGGADGDVLGDGNAASRTPGFSGAARSAGLWPH